MMQARQLSPAGSPEGQPAYTPMQRYLLRRLHELEQRQREMPPAFHDHPIGRLLDAALKETVEECRWYGLGPEAAQIVQSSRDPVSA